MFIPTLLAVLLGMRRGEIAAFRWRSVDLEAGQVAVLESAEQMNGKPPKSGQERTVALAQTIVDEIARPPHCPRFGVMDRGCISETQNYNGREPVTWLAFASKSPELPASLRRKLRE